LDFRPFNAMPGLSYRRFFLPIYGRNAGDSASVEIRVEQGHEGKAFRFEFPKDLIANLLWFDQLADFRLAAHLRSWAPGESSSATAGR
jgi:hypothetical protein